ncbi:MAG: ferric reductase-like transmembrane domain-containing protein, partial [Steroidobacteraceae bacterium]
GLYVQVARGCGACLNLNGALIAVPMLRRALTRLRRSSLGRVVPVDDAVSLHALIGEVIVVLSLVHTVAHGLHLSRTGADPYALANVTGALALVVLFVIWLCSRNFVRRSGRFELFYLTHLGYLGFVTLLFLHGPRFWIWGTLPWSWFLIERTLRARRRGKPGRVLGAHPLASGVTRLEIERPLGFFYAPGDYVFLCLSRIARHEWHPFTLTSAPEDPERLSVHVRSLGNWTAAVRERTPELLRGADEVQAYVDGPYGTASRHLLDAPHAVAVAGGIGVTPFMSIVRHAAHEKLPHSIVLMCSNRKPEDAPFLEELQQLEQKRRGNFRLLATMTGAADPQWRGHVGTINAELIHAVVTPTTLPVFYIAGPPAMVAAMRGVLNGMGVEDDDIRSEDFTGY